MTTTKQLVENLRLQGCVLTLKGEKVLFTSPKGMPSGAKDAVLAHVRALRQEIIAYLVYESSPTKEGVAGFLAACGVPTCAGCYSLGHNLHIHPPRSAYNYDRK